MPVSLDSICADLNTIMRWLACDPPTDEQVRQAQAIVLPGNQVLATFNLACELAQKYPAKPLLFSGGIGHSTPQLFENFAVSPRYAPYVSREMAEAEMYGAAAEGAWHIPRSQMMLETGSLNCGENARYSLRVLQKAGLGDGPVLLLQDPLMLRRSVLTWQREAELAGLQSNAIPCGVFVPHVEPGPDDLPQLVRNHASGSWSFERFLGLALGEIYRLRDDESGYGPKGRNFFEHVDTPAEVAQAFQRVTASHMATLARR